MDMTKKEARLVVQSRLNTIMTEQYHSLSDAVFQKVDKMLHEYRRENDVHSVLSYTAVTRWCEVSLMRLEASHRAVSFDYVSCDPTSLLPSRQYDVILVPLYGFNNAGYRLGHGGGWYDRLLSEQAKAFIIGVGLEAGHIEFPPEPHDVPLSALVTEGRYEILQKRRRR